MPIIPIVLDEVICHRLRNFSCSLAKSASWVAMVWSSMERMRRAVRARWWHQLRQSPWSQQGRHKHLHDRIKRIYSAQSTGLNRNTDDRKGGLGRYHTWQMSRTARSCDDDLNATLTRLFSMAEHEVWGAVGRDHFLFIGYAKFVQHIGCFFMVFQSELEPMMMEMECSYLSFLFFIPYFTALLPISVR